jgi:hypothetical protein
MLLVITPPMARSAKFWRVPAQQRSVTPSSHREEKAESLVRIYNIHQPYRCKSAISQIDLPCMPYGWYIGNRSTGYFVTYSAFAPVRLTCTGQSAVALVILASKLTPLNRVEKILSVLLLTLLCAVVSLVGALPSRAATHAHRGNVRHSPLYCELHNNRPISY